ncbi:MAG: SigE family RNA polymerase sigma factor [Nocardioides sp.]
MSGLDPGRDGFETFVAARRQALVRTAYLLTGSREDAEDLVQVALVKAVPHWHRIAEHPEAYVRRIVARESVSRWRRRRWREVATGDLPETGTAPSAAEDREVLRAALLGLPPRQRAVIVLRYYEDLTERQTAEVLGIAVGTVKSQARDGLAALRRVVPDVGAEDGERLTTVEP